MPDAYHLSGAHPSFPITAPALQRASLRPDSIYFETHTARKLSASLIESGTPFTAGELSAVGLMGKICLSLVSQYLATSAQDLTALDSFVLQELSSSAAHSALLTALDSFPTTSTLQDPQHKQAISLIKEGGSNLRHEYYLSLLLVLLADQNPALRSRDGFFTDPDLRSSTVFQPLSRCIQDFFSTPSSRSPKGHSLLDVLLEPIRHYPDSILGQLSFMAHSWKNLIDPDLLQRILSQMDQLKEELRLPGTRSPGFSGNPLGQIKSRQQGLEEVRFSPDGDWMPRVILQAKNAFVWLDQLSKKYQRPIQRLDQIPAAELAAISRSGINALWLIGLWERSPASQKIKQLCGNPEAVSSAYSLYDYAISEQLGGEAAYQSLSRAAAAHNLKLAADMVPNHVGIDSRWVAKHPDWFLSLDHPPFPAYSFSGVDLSSDPAVSLILEDHYYDKTDASVVFKRIDHNSGEVRYLYHGNDGTAMPWNDTAQLDFLNPETREAVIQTILHVARKFPIIRFDAAMTLAKKHFQRLWFPEPGSGGAIPTRSQFGLTKSEFDKQMPQEFWREVVDRVAQEAPDTLLLAEAFWMMEGYFVRNLGMHRVYNSAFMHMLRDEENQKYRQLITDTLAIDPQILKRYVNFMNNPDEETAAAQFGTDGKYFGTCLMMCTMPGLPMFGHGQIEGLTEKYGMEYKKAYLDESPNQGLASRHEAEVFPILHKRYLFANVENFVLYDLELESGTTCQDVFVYSNRFHSERSLVVYHNKWGSAAGRVKRSAAVNGISLSIADGLEISPEDGDYLFFTDSITGLEYLHPIGELLSNGLPFNLGAYDYQVLLDFRTVNDLDGLYQKLHDRLAGQGVSNLEYHKKEIEAEPLAAVFGAILSALIDEQKALDHKPQIHSLEHQIEELRVLVDTCWHQTQELGLHQDPALPKEAILSRLKSLFQLISGKHLDFLPGILPWLVPWACLAPLSQTQLEAHEPLFSSYGKAALHIDSQFTFPPERIPETLKLPFILADCLSARPWNSNRLQDIWFTTPSIRDFLGVHEYNGLSYFHQESMEILLAQTFALIALDEFTADKLADDPSTTLALDDRILHSYRSAAAALTQSNYVVSVFIDLYLSDQTGGLTSA